MLWERHYAVGALADACGYRLGITLMNDKKIPRHHHFNGAPGR